MFDVLHNTLSDFQICVMILLGFPNHLRTSVGALISVSNSNNIDIFLEVFQETSGLHDHNLQ